MVHPQFITSNMISYIDIVNLEDVYLQGLIRMEMKLPILYSSFVNYAVQSEKAVSAYHTSEQTLPFGFVEQKYSFQYIFKNKF